MGHGISPQVRMANEIAVQFRHWKDQEEAATAIAAHIRKFWAPRMVADLLSQVRTDAQAIDPLAIAAAHKLT